MKSARFNYKFSKWLAGYFPQFTINEHNTIVGAATDFVLEVYCGERLDQIRELIKTMYEDNRGIYDEEREAKLLEMVSDDINDWYISSTPVIEGRRL